MRRDVHVPNESDGFVFASAAVRGRGIAPGSADWAKALATCDLLPLAVESEDDANVRVVVGEPLRDDERTQWVGRVEAGLRLRDGRLALCGGVEYVMEKAGGAAPRARLVDVPPGDYRATLYCYVSAPNGHQCLERSGSDEPLGKWFRSARPGQDMPAWLHNMCVNDPSLDPGHRGQWRRARLRNGPPVIDFLLHLETIDAPLSPAQVAERDFAEATDCRKPEQFPMGIAAVELEGSEDAATSAEAPVAAKVVAVPSDAGAFELRTIEGGPVNVPIVKLARLARLAWLCQPYTHPSLVVSFPSKAEGIAELDDIEGVEPRVKGRELHVLFEDSGQPAGAYDAMVAVARLLSKIPAGSVIELNIARKKDSGARPPGRHRYRGPVAEGAWHVTESFPRLEAARLSEALGLAEALENGRRMAARDEAEAERIEARVARHASEYFTVNPLQRTGAELALRRRDPALMLQVVSRAFWMRYADVWPLQDEDDDA